MSLNPNSIPHVNTKYFWVVIINTDFSKICNYHINQEKAVLYLFSKFYQEFSAYFAKSLRQ